MTGIRAGRVCPYIKFGYQRSASLSAFTTQWMHLSSTMMTYGYYNNPSERMQENVWQITILLLYKIV